MDTHRKCPYGHISTHFHTKTNAICNTFCWHGLDLFLSNAQRIFMLCGSPYSFCLQNITREPGLLGHIWVGSLYMQSYSKPCSGMLFLTKLQNVSWNKIIISRFPAYMELLVHWCRIHIQSKGRYFPIQLSPKCSFQATKGGKSHETDPDGKLFILTGQLRYSEGTFQCASSFSNWRYAITLLNKCADSLINHITGFSSSFCTSLSAY